MKYKSCFKLSISTVSKAHIRIKVTDIIKDSLRLYDCWNVQNRGLIPNQVIWILLFLKEERSIFTNAGINLCLFIKVVTCCWYDISFCYLRHIVRIKRCSINILRKSKTFKVCYEHPEICFDARLVLNFWSTMYNNIFNKSQMM